MSRGRLHRIVSAVFALLIGCATERTPTQTVIDVDADGAVRAAARSLHLQITDDAESPAFERTRPTRKWPLRLVLAPRGGDATKQFDLDVEAQDELGQVVARARLRSGFVRDQARYVRLRMVANCEAAPRIELAADRFGRSASSPNTVDACSGGSEPSEPIEPSDGGVDADAPEAGPNPTTRDPKSPVTGASGSSGSMEPVANPNAMPAHAGGTLDGGACDDDGGCDDACSADPNALPCECVGGALQADGRTCSTWTEPLALDQSPADASIGLQLAMNASGEAVLGFRKAVNGGATLAYFARFVPGDGFTGPAPLDFPQPMRTSTAPQVAIDRAGNHAAVWGSVLGGTSSVLAAQLNRSTSAWTDPVELETSTVVLDAGVSVDAFTPLLAGNAAGELATTWKSESTGSLVLRARRLTPGGTWTAAVPLTLERTELAEGSMALTLDGSGAALCGWMHDGFSQTPSAQVWINRSARDMPAGVAAPLDGDDTGLRTYPDSLRVVANERGIAYAIWLRTAYPDNAGYRRAVVVRRYDPASGWGPATALVDVETRQPSSPAIAIDADGNAVAVWTLPDRVQSQTNTRPNTVVFASLFTASGWSEPENIDIVALGDSGAPRVTTDSRGNFIAIWGRSNGVDAEVWTARRALGSRWSRPYRLEHVETGPVYSSVTAAANTSPQIAVDERGRAVALWMRPSGSWQNLIARLLK